MEGQALYDARYVPGVVDRGCRAMKEIWRFLEQESVPERADEWLKSVRQLTDTWQSWRNSRRQQDLTARELEEALHSVDRVLRRLEVRCRARASGSHT